MDSCEHDADGRHGGRHSGAVSLEGADLAQLLEAAGDVSRARRRSAAAALQAAAGDAEVAAELERACRQGPLDRRWTIAFALARSGRGGGVVLDTLLDGLGADDGDLRWASHELLVTALREGLAAGQSQDASGGVAEERAAGAADLLERIRRMAAALTAEDKPAEDKPAASAAAEATSAPAEMSGSAPAEVGAPDLTPLGPEAVAGRMALHVLRDLGGEPASTFTAALDVDDAFVRMAALVGLRGAVGVDGDVLARVLGVLHDDGEARVRRAAAAVLGHLGAGDPAVRQALERAAATAQDPDLRRGAAQALRRLERQA